MRRKSTTRDMLLDMYILVIGGAGALGQGICRRIAEQGAKVIVTSRTMEKALAACMEICQHLPGELHDNVIPMVVDIYDEKSIAALREQILTLGWQLDGIVKCAGGNRPEATLQETQGFLHMNVEAMKTLVGENIGGLFNVAKHLVPLLGENPDGGSFVSIGSMAGMRPLSKVGAYGAEMAAEHNFVQWLARECAARYGDRVRCNVVAPGFFPAEQNQSLIYADAEKTTLTPRGAKIIGGTPFARLGKPYEDLSGLVAFLLSDMSCFMTGTVIPVDGGFSANSGV